VLGWEGWLADYRDACDLRTAALTSAQKQRCSLTVDDLIEPTAPNFYTNDHRVRSLYPLRNIRRVSGFIEVSGCALLERFDGAFGKLESVGHSWLNDVAHRQYSPITLLNNTRLRGVVQSMFPSLPHGNVRAGVVANNPELCSDAADLRFVSTGNKPSILCTCDRETPPKVTIDVMPPSGDVHANTATATVDAMVGGDTIACPAEVFGLGAASDAQFAVVTDYGNRAITATRADDPQTQLVTWDEPVRVTCNQSYTEMCDVAQCHSCATGTSGRCYYQPQGAAATATERVCVPRVPGTGDCPFLAGIGPSDACDLCEGHGVCDDAPQCKEQASGECDSATGVCKYAGNSAHGTHCDDGSPFTGPDVCDGKGSCTTTDACVVATKLDVKVSLGAVHAPLSAVALTTQTQVNEFGRCGTIHGSLNLDCGIVPACPARYCGSSCVQQRAAAAANLAILPPPTALSASALQNCTKPSDVSCTCDPIKNADALRGVAKITGVLRVADCPLLTELAFPHLQHVEGMIEDQSIILERNENLAGGVHQMFPAVSTLLGGVRATGNPTLCMNSYSWYREVTDSGNAAPERCGCTNGTKMNFKPTADIDDGLCTDWPCDGTGTNGTQSDAEKPCQYEANDCRTRTCNPETNGCEFDFFTCSTAGCCNDADKFTVADQCKPGANGDVECQGTDVCDDDVQVAFCNEHDSGRDARGDDECTFLSYCSVPDDRANDPEDAACIWGVRPEGTLCDTVSAAPLDLYCVCAP
jgi:hypothetical protein